MTQPVIQQSIFEIRGLKVMLDRDLALLYDIPVKSLNLAVKRNMDRFPNDFMFQLTTDEFSNLRFQIETSSWGGNRYMPYAFTELGISMLSSVLRTPRAIQMNIVIMRTFVFVRQNINVYTELASRMEEISRTVATHGERLNLIYELIGNFITKKEEEQNWKDRERIGFAAN